MTDALVALNGMLVPASEARVSPLDRGLLFGDGLFETIRVYGGRPFALDRHLARLFRSLTALRIEIPERPADLARICRDLIAADGATDTVLRITITRGPVPGPLGLGPAEAPTRLVHLRTLRTPTAELLASGVRATVAPDPFARSATLCGHKTLNYLDSLAAKQHAAEAGAFEALWINGRGELVEGASSNLFVVRDGRVTTPPLAAGALPGITRAICLEQLAARGVPHDEEPVPLADLRHVDELFLTNSVAEIVPVVDVDGLTVGRGSPGAMSRWLADAYRALVRAGLDR